jgi:hypothetical protein
MAALRLPLVALLVVAQVSLPHLARSQPCPTGDLFGATTTLPMTAPQFGVSARDLNGDGVADLALSSQAISGSNPGNVSVFFGAVGGGGVTYSAGVAYPVGRDPRGSVITDLNGDGAMDLVVACEGGGLYVLRGLRDGADLPTGQFAAAVLYSLGSCWDVATADINADGLKDLVVSVRGGNITTLLGSPASTPTNIVLVPSGSFAAGANPKGLRLADIDQDGVLDAVVALESSSIAVMRGLSTGGVPNGQFQLGVSIATGGLSFDVALGDFDSNGRIDIAVATYIGNTCAVLLNQGNLQFAITSYATPGVPLSIEAGDINLDGVVDLALSSAGQGRVVSVLIGRSANGVGTGLFDPPVMFGVGTAYAVALADLDGNGSLDVAGANHVQNTFHYLLNACAPGPSLLQVNIVGNGTVLVDPDLEVYPPNTEVTLTAIPGAHHHFTAWGGAASGANPVVTILMNGPRFVTANFLLDSYPLSVTLHGQGAGTVSTTPSMSTYPHGSLVRLEALPELGSVFVAWGGDASGTENPLDILMDLPRDITAEFQVDPQILPEIIEVADVPLDQGGKVKIRWRASSWDRLSGHPLAVVKKYFVWREVPSNFVAAETLLPDSRGLHRTVENGDEFFWEYVTTLPASAFPGTATRPRLRTIRPQGGTRTRAS